MATIEIEELRADAPMRRATVDRENNRINGYVLAQEGEFKSKGRGRFDKNGIKDIVSLAKEDPAGMPCAFQHPNMCDDGLGSHLGRLKDPWLSTVNVMRDGRPVTLSCARCNLQLDPTAMAPPPGGGTPYGKYVMDLIESDPKAISSSLRIEADQQPVMDPTTKKPMVDENGERVAPIWNPMKLHGSDVVATGDAVDSITGQNLSAHGLPHNLMAKASKMLNRMFLGQSRESIRERLLGWMDRELDSRFGTDAPEVDFGEEIDLDEPESLGANDNPYNSLCPECKLPAIGSCRCPGPHTPEDLKKGHGLRCANGHNWSRNPPQLGIASNVAAMRTRLAADKLGIHSLGTIPKDPPGGEGKAVKGKFTKPTLKDFTDKKWNDLSPAERKKIAAFYGWYSNLDSFGNLKLPHHFASGPNKGKASADACSDAMARLNQVQGMSDAERNKVRAHLQAHLNAA